MQVGSLSTMSLGSRAHHEAYVEPSKLAGVVITISGQGKGPLDSRFSSKIAARVLDATLQEFAYEVNSYISW